MNSDTVFESHYNLSPSNRDDPSSAKEKMSMKRDNSIGNGSPGSHSSRMRANSLSQKKARSSSPKRNSSSRQNALSSSPKRSSSTRQNALSSSPKRSSSNRRSARSSTPPPNASKDEPTKIRAERARRSPRKTEPDRPTDEQKLKQETRGRRSSVGNRSGPPVTKVDPDRPTDEQKPKQETRGRRSSVGNRRGPPVTKADPDYPTDEQKPKQETRGHRSSMGNRSGPPVTTVGGSSRRSRDQNSLHSEFIRRERLPRSSNNLTSQGRSPVRTKASRSSPKTPERASISNKRASRWAEVHKRVKQLGERPAAPIGVSASGDISTTSPRSFSPRTPLRSSPRSRQESVHLRRSPVRTKESKSSPKTPEHASYSNEQASRWAEVHNKVKQLGERPAAPLAVSASGDISTTSPRPFSRQESVQLRGLLQKLRDPSNRNLMDGEESEDEDDDEGKGKRKAERKSTRNLLRFIKPGPKGYGYQANVDQ
jgi:hypothetical protein